jgi:hypothetical protein
MGKQQTVEPKNQEALVNFMSDKFYKGGEKDKLREKLTKDPEVFERSLSLMHEDSYKDKMSYQEFKEKYVAKHGNPHPDVEKKSPNETGEQELLGGASAAPVPQHTKPSVKPIGLPSQTPPVENKLLGNQTLEQAMTPSEKAFQEFSAGKNLQDASKDLLAKNSHLNFIQRATSPEKYPTIKNEDGSFSTHLMAWGEGPNGKPIVFPTIIQQKDGTLKKFDNMDDAYDHAVKNKEYVETPDDKTAAYFSEHGYKQNAFFHKPEDLQLAQIAQAKARLKETPESGKESNPLVTGYKTMKDFVANQVPKTIASTAAALMPDNPHLLGPDYARGINYYNQTEEEKKGYKEGATETKKLLVNYAGQQDKESQEETGNLAKSLGDVHSFGDLMNYVVHNTANAAAQIPLAVLTGGGSAVMQEVGNHYMEGVNEIAKRKGITPAEVIEKGLDQSAIAIASGALAGGLETLGAKGVAGAINKNALWGTVRDKAYKVFKSTAGEALTEGGQNIIEQASTKIQAGEKPIDALRKTDVKEVAENMAGATVGALGLHGISSGGKLAIDKVAELTSKKHQIDSDLGKEDVTTASKEILQTQKETIDNDLEKAKQEVHDEHEKVVNTPPTTTPVAEPVEERKAVPAPEEQPVLEAKNEEIAQKEPLEPITKPIQETKNEPTKTILPTGEREIKKPVELTERDQKVNRLKDMVEEFNSLRKGAKGKDAMLNKIKLIARNELGFKEVNGHKDFVDIPELNAIKRKNTVTNTTEIEDHVPLENREPKAKEFISKVLAKAKEDPQFLMGIGAGISKKEVASTIKDIETGKKTVRANNVLDILEKAHRDKGLSVSMGSGFLTQRAHISLEDYLGEKHPNEEITTDEHIGKAVEHQQIYDVLNEFTDKDYNVDYKKLKQKIVDNPDFFTDFPYSFNEHELEYLKQLVDERTGKTTNEGEVQKHASLGEGSERGREENTGEKREEVAENKPIKDGTGVVPTNKGILPLTSETLPPIETQDSEKGSEKKERSYPKQFFNDHEIAEDIKKGLSEDAKKYIPTSNEINNKEAQAIVKEKGLENAIHDLVNTSNDIKPGVRTVLGHAIIKQANQAMKDFPAEKEKYLKLSLEAADFTSKHLTELGQGVQAASVYNLLSPEGLILHARKVVKEHRDKALKRHEPEIKTKEEALNKINEQIINKLLDVKDVQELIDSKEENHLKKAKKRKVTEAIDFLESLKIDVKNKAYDITYALPAELYNGAITVLQTSLKAGDTVAKAVSKAVAHIKQKHTGAWDEKGFKEYFNSHEKLNNAVLDPEKAIKSELKNLKTTIKEVIKKHYTKAEDIKNTLTEKLVKEAGLEEKEAADLAKEIQKKFTEMATKAKNDYIKQKSPKDLKEVVNKVIPSSVDQQLIELSNAGALTNEQVRKVYAEKLGIKDITTEEAERIIELGEKIQEADNFAEETKENFTPANIEKYIKLKKEQTKAVTEIGEILADKKPKSIADTLSTVMQGNLLTPISLLTNVYSNALLAPLRSASRLVAQGIDLGFSKLFGKPKAIDILAANRGYNAGFVKGLGQSFTELKTGPQSEEIKKFDIGRGFKPVKAFLAGFNPKQKQTINERINNLIEGTVGAPAEVFFRALNFGDKPFEVAAQLAKAYELSELKGLKGTEIEKFLMFPDEQSAELIKKAGEDATFKGENVVSHGASKLSNWIYKSLGEVPYLGGFLKVLAKSQMPYVKTPINIIIESFDYALPQLSLLKSIYYGTKGERVKCEEFLGKAAIGFMVHAAADLLFKNGLLSGGPEEDKKERALQYQAFNAKGLNLSGLMRLMSGGNPAIKPNDTFIQYDKMGIPGNILNMRAELGEKKEGKEFDNLFTELIYDTFAAMPNIAGTALEQSFLSGTSTLLEAIKSGEWDNWMSNTFGAIASIPIPNTVSSIAKANRENIPEVRDPDIMKRLGNVLKTKVGLVNGLPVKIDLWGQPIKQTPAGAANPYVYHLMDVTKSRDITTDKLSYEVYKVWKATDNKDVIPSAPSSTVSVGKDIKIKLTPQQYERYLRSVGNARKVLSTALITNDGYDKLSDDTKVDAFQNIYKEGAKIGKLQFLQAELQRNSKFLIEGQKK